MLKMNRWNKQIFLHADINLGKLKVILIILGLGMVENGCDHLGHMNIKLAVFYEWIKYSGQKGKRQANTEIVG